MWFGIVSLFPEMFSALDSGVAGRAIKDGLLDIKYWSPRDFATDKYKTVDDKAYGGGPGMVMMTAPLQAAIQAAKQAAPKPAKVVYLSPQGKVFNQQAAKRFAETESVIFVSGRYEGIDERLIESEIDEEWSIGDYILTGGELASMVMIDAISRHVPGVIGDDQSVAQDSLENGLLKHPQYTRPEEFAGKSVPKVLLSGHHKEIERWRAKQALGQTWRKRPDLLAKLDLSDQEKALLDEFIRDFHA
jgi:tRNA (guanine37-N1)-methyltransferase